MQVERLHNLADNDKMLRTAATTVLGLMKQRIHEDGLDANGRAIGTYSKGYMVLRTGAYVNAKRVTKGANKNKLKDAGVFTKGATEKANRPKFNRTSDSKVILSLTRQMENDMKVIPLKKPSYGIGFSNKENYDKSQWCEATYNLKGKIFALSSNEKEVVITIAKKFAQDAISK